MKASCIAPKILPRLALSIVVFRSQQMLRRLQKQAHCLAVLPQAYAFVKANIASGTITLVHCSSGKDRTGLFMAYFLVMSGYSAVDAMTRVKAVRPIAFSADGWDVFALKVLTQA
jgi:protein-tyrosine phosphatase